MGAGSLDRSSAAGRAPLLSELGVVTPLHYRILALCFFAWIFDFYDLILYSFLLVPIARELRLTETDSSFVLGLSFLMTAVGGVAFGFIGDRFGRRPVIIATVLIYSLGTLLCATARSTAELLVYRAFTGIGIGGEWAAGQSMIAETFPRHSRARYAGYVQTGAPLGILIAAVTGGYLAPIWGWRAVFAFSAAPAVLVAAAIWRWLPESDVWLQGRSGRWFSIDDWHALRPHRNIVLLLFFLLLFNSEAYWFTYSWLPGYLELKRGLTSQASGKLVITMQCAAVAGYLAFGAIADRYGRRPAFSLYGVMMALGLLPVTIFWPWAVSVRGLISIAIAIAGFGTGMWSGAGPLTSELLPTRVRNMALGLQLNVTRGIQFFTPLVITALSPRVGFGPTLALGALFAGIGATLIWTLPETRGRSITALDRDINSS